MRGVSSYLQSEMCIEKTSHIFIYMYIVRITNVTSLLLWTWIQNFYSFYFINLESDLNCLLCLREPRSFLHNTDSFLHNTNSFLLSLSLVPMSTSTTSSSRASYPSSSMSREAVGYQAARLATCCHTWTHQAARLATCCRTWSSRLAHGAPWPPSCAAQHITAPAAARLSCGAAAHG
jgi:hypothetical protein